MTIIGNSPPVRAAALRLSSANRCGSQTPRSPEPSAPQRDREVISQGDKDRSKIGADNDLRRTQCLFRHRRLKSGGSAISLSKSEGRQPETIGSFGAEAVRALSTGDAGPVWSLLLASDEALLRVHGEQGHN
jgi:hypothetical protein